MQKYGFPYKGSKNKLAERFIDFFPKATNFYDLFAGGFAITHAALLSEKWERYYANDLNPLCVQLFNDAVKGKYHNETRWISRNDFYKLKDTDGYVAFIWSFGNNGRDYLYSQKTEPYKKAWHKAIFNNDFEDFKMLCGVDLSSIKDVKTKHEKYLKSKSLFRKGEQLYSYLNEIRLLGLERLERLERLETSVSTYKNIKIKPNSIVFCDIPYINTNVYGNKKTVFNHAEFYEWCSKQKELVFISSYEMPEDFVCVNKYVHRSTLSATANNKVIEKLFIPKHQIELYNELKNKESESYLFPEYFNKAV